jgi:hypothetical protein
MLGYVLLWLWMMQSEPLDGDASDMRAVNFTNIARHRAVRRGERSHLHAERAGGHRQHHRPAGYR